MTRKLINICIEPTAPNGTLFDYVDVVSSDTGFEPLFLYQPLRYSLFFMPCALVKKQPLFVPTLPAKKERAAAGRLFDTSNRHFPDRLLYGAGKHVSRMHFHQAALVSTGEPFSTPLLHRTTTLSDTQRPVREACLTVCFL